MIDHSTDSRSDQLPDGLIAQLGEHCTSITARGYGFESRSGLNFYQALILQLLKLCV